MVIKGYSHSPKLQHYWNLTIRLFSVISKILIEGVLLFYRDAISVFWSPSRLGHLSISDNNSFAKSVNWWFLPPFYFCPVNGGGGIRKHWLYPLQSDKILPKDRYPGFDPKLYLVIRLQFWRSGKREVPFIDITSSSTLTRSPNTFYGPIYESNISFCYLFGWVWFLMTNHPYTYIKYIWFVNTFCR